MSPTTERKNRIRLLVLGVRLSPCSSPSELEMADELEWLLRCDEEIMTAFGALVDFKEGRLPSPDVEA